MCAQIRPEKSQEKKEAEMEETVPELREKVKKKCAEVQRNFDEIFGCLPRTLKVRLVKTLGSFVICCVDGKVLPPSGIWEPFTYQRNRGLWLQAGRIEIDDPPFHCGFQIGDVPGVYYMGMRDRPGMLAFISDNVTGLLRRANDCEQVALLLESWFHFFINKLGEHIDEMERTVIRLENESDNLVMAVFQATQGLAATKTFAKSKTIKGIREELERAIPKGYAYCGARIKRPPSGT